MHGFVWVYCFNFDPLLCMTVSDYTVPCGNLLSNAELDMYDFSVKTYIKSITTVPNLSMTTTLSHIFLHDKALRQVFLASFFFFCKQSNRWITENNLLKVNCDLKFLCQGESMSTMQYTTHIYGETSSDLWKGYLHLKFMNNASLHWGVSMYTRW